jgi:hypothetical protein
VGLRRPRPAYAGCMSDGSPALQAFESRPGDDRRLGPWALMRSGSRWLKRQRSEVAMPEVRNLMIGSWRYQAKSVLLHLLRQWLLSVA